MADDIRTRLKGWPALPKMDYKIHPLMGSGYENGLKQGRAEVLATCIRRIEHLRGKWSLDDDRAQHALLRAGEELEELQPAAEALKELLRDTETKAIDEQQEPMSCGHAAANLQPSDGPTEFCVVCELLREAEAKGLRLSCIGVDDRLDSHNHQQACACCRRIAELEKVRASEGKG